MQWKDTKYLIAYLTPASAFAALYFGGFWSLATVYIAFVLIPLLELLLPRSISNYSESQEQSRANTAFFDWLLYLNLPILFILLYCYFQTITGTELTRFEFIGMSASMGVVISSIGINVAHELGHRQTAHEQWMSKTLLMTALYMHFYIEHNRGHHKQVATDDDPASSRFGENIYAFWWRSVKDSYLHAWQLEGARLQAEGRLFWSWHNEMIRFQFIQLLYLASIGFMFGWWAIPFAILIAITGALLLETVNYIEHYGLRRRRLDSRHYEKVSAAHSWNSDHELGRIFLYELTRHSDHHFKATRKYQLLRHLDESPQLPLGYPASMLLALIPPLWFRQMNHRVLQHQS